MLTDLRGGSGERKTTGNRLLAAMQWRIDDRIDLTFGVQVDWQTTETTTREIVLARMQSVYQSTQPDYNWIYGNDESKDLLWTFKAERSSFRIPIILTIRASEVFDVLLGLNRTMTHSTIDDITLALFRYRQANANGTMTREENFGERYTTPQEKVSDVQTTFLAGLTASPTRQFQVRFLVVPNFRDTFDGSELDELQWWIGVSLTP
jgi:outer membrane receptor protein involved in Fe transport